MDIIPTCMNISFMYVFAFIYSHLFRSMCIYLSYSGTRVTGSHHLYAFIFTIIFALYIYTLLHIYVYIWFTYVQTVRRVPNISICMQVLLIYTFPFEHWHLFTHIYIYIYMCVYHFIRYEVYWISPDSGMVAYKFAFKYYHLFTHVNIYIYIYILFY